MNIKKVYFLNKIIYFFSDDKWFDKLPYDDFLLSRSSSADAMLIDFQHFLNQDDILQFVYFGNSYKKKFQNFILNFRLIKAAGGLITNEKNQFLFIFRNGKWDLPKGKVEKRETIRIAAKRECQEECGIEKVSLGRKIIDTYHFYELKGELVLKVTSWYFMASNSNEKLAPQIEEGITKIRWVGKSNLKEVLKNTYSTILDVLNSYSKL